MSSLALRFANVSKRFVFAPDRPQTILETVIATVSGRPRRPRQELWAACDVSFDVRPGESLGLIGRNGSGKSTILKLAARILRPTSGQVEVHGRVGALLELGAGFHPDLTGRENIFLNGSLLGLGRQQMRSLFDSIVAFSELEEFIDMPVKHYSSGMYMRLGFSVAVHVEPELLIVDEILAVGDQAFQGKCLERIHEMKDNGVTIVLVSHNLDSVARLCRRLLWLDHGRLHADGPTDELISRYLAELHQLHPAASAVNGRQDFRRWGTGEVEITHVRFLDEAGLERPAFKTGDVVTIELGYQARVPVVEPEFGLAIHSHDGFHVNGPNNRQAGLHLGRVEGAGTLRYTMERLPLLPGIYRVTAAVHDSAMTRAYDYHEQAYPFLVVAGGSKESHGVVEIPAVWEWRPVASGKW
ncbi:MAG: ABC transporter ATP-binding protein [Chloroflexota bacterium]